MNRASFFVPLGLFVLIVGIGGTSLFLDDRKVLPSPLIGQPFPEFEAPLLRDPTQRLDASSLLGRPMLVNVWATWCPTCKAEHQTLIDIRERTGLEIVGVNYKDDRAKAIGWLERFGDPYTFNLYDEDGQLGIELGVYGAPETFLLNTRGEIVYKRVGDVNERIWREEILPRLQQMEEV